ncbi:unnamed protein product [Rotaria socialis]|uniref:G-protein coupled receptors family 1 profile domain-containing protein n=1 Tax=Rotaria socialis TaxID=392032 RepID=A0A818IUE7_9BILA|nr:unnamed protein product [Rotaria socialis]CAF3527341.1 unnamed protein product [Rotaria socialis]CAF4224178.1 unnamed protein product [Rotaria socialis]CAF4231370.1 unnamed protein product [Rotaria socialis]
MVSGHQTNNSSADIYANVMQGKILFQGCQLPTLIWNQIKILIVSNKDEFDIERDTLMTETLPKLQQYFLTQGIYVNFIDCNLNWDLDLSRNPYHVLRYMKELDDAYKTSAGVFLLTFVGNKYGSVVLPIELSTTDFNNIKNIASDLNKDVKLLERWYLLDDKLLPPAYKLKDPDDEFSNLLSRTVSTYDISIRESQEWNDIYVNLADLFTSVLHEKPNLKSKHDTSSMYDIQLLSSVEMLFNYAAKLSPSGCMCVLRQFDGFNEKNKGNEPYIDLLTGSNRLDKHRQEKLKRFRESIANKLSINDDDTLKIEDNRILFNISWKENGDFQTDDADHQRYLRTLNAAIFLRIKFLCEHHIDLSISTRLKYPDQILYNETLIHSTHYSRLSSNACLGFENFIENNQSFKQWFSSANTDEHYPLMIIGNRASGKTLLCTKLVQYLLNTLGKNVQCIMRYFNLTSRSQNIAEVFNSISAQLKTLQNVPAITDDQKFSNIESYQSILKSLSENNKPLILMIDGIEEAASPSQYTSSIIFYQTLLQLLPPKVYAIISVTRNVHTNPNSDVKIREIFERLEKTQCMIELPFTNETISINELNLYIKSELNLIKRNVTDSVLQALSKCIYQQIDKQSQIFFLLRLVLNESYFSYLSQRKKKLDLTELNIEEIFNAYIDHCEKKFGTKICALIFNYISSSQSAIHELELLDILSCNNEFFLEYFQKNLPKYLRFPPSLWIAVKYLLGPLLSVRYFDSKVVICWSHSFIRRHMKQKYLKRVEDIRFAHRDMSNYFLEAFIESKPLVDMNRNVQLRGDPARRFILQQPLLYSETAYNYRRLHELWYQLMHSGDIDRLKEYTVCCFEYLLAKIHGLSIEQLLWEIEIICSNILDADVLIVQTILKNTVDIVSNDPILLAGEIILRLRNIKSYYNEHIESLFVQAHDWCESCSIPVFVPLSSWISATPPLVITTLPCSGGAFKVTATTFNQHVFCTTRKNEIAMYHIPSKKLVKTFSGHTSLITSIQLTHDSKFLVSTSTDRTIKLFNLNSGELENNYQINQNEILCTTLSHDNQLIVVGTRDRLIIVCHFETGEIEHSIEQHTDAVTGVGLTQDDALLISASRDQTIKRWTFRGMQLLDIIDTIGSPITHLIVSTDDTFIIVSCENTTVQVKSLVTGSDIHNLEGHSSAVTSLSMSNDSMCCYVGCSNGSIYVYNLRSRILLRSLQEHDSAVNDLFISADDCFLFSAAENAIHVLNVKQQFTGFVTEDPLSSTDYITALSISREGDAAIAGCAAGSVRLFNLVDGEFSAHIIDHPAPVTQVALSHSYLFSLSGSKDTTIKVYDNEMGEIVTEFTHHTAPIAHVRILEDNRKILSSDEQNYIKTWWANTGELIDSYNTPCKMLGVSPDGKYVVSGNGDNLLKIWSLDDARVVRSIDHTEGKITCMAFRADSQYLVTGGEDFSCKLWELSSGKLTQVLVEHEQLVTAVAISEDKKHVLTGDKDGHAIIWSFKDGAVVHKLIRHKTAIVTAAFTIDSNIAITASQDGLLSAWSTMTGILLAAFHFNHILVKLLVAQTGARYAAILQNTCCVAMLGLFNISSSDTSKPLERHCQMFSDPSNTLLPIKPKPFLYPKDSTLMSDSRHVSKSDQVTSDTILDLILITLNCIRLIIRYTFQSYFLQRSLYICRTYKFLTSYFSHCAVWILCVISLERAAVTKRYVWNKNVFSHKHSYCTLIIMYIILFFLNIHYLIYFGSKQERNYDSMSNDTDHKLLAMCSSNLRRSSKEKYEHFLIYYFSWMDFLINSLVPFIIILIANTSVMHSVYKSRIYMKQIGIRQTRSPRDTQLAYILFVSTFLFLLLTFPLRVFSVIEPYLNYEKKYLILLDGIMRFLLYLDHGCGFYLYTFTGELFRRELRKFFYECLFKIFRHRYFNWSYVESRRQSELSCSNGMGGGGVGGGGGGGGSHFFHQLQHANIQLRDSLSSCTGAGTGTGIKTSLHSLPTHKIYQPISYHQCAYAKSSLTNKLSASSSRSKLTPLTGRPSLYLSEQKHGLVKRHSSSCFESQYKPMTIPCTSQNPIPAHDLDRKSDII